MGVLLVASARGDSADAENSRAMHRRLDLGQAGYRRRPQKATARSTVSPPDRFRARVDPDQGAGLDGATNIHRGLRGRPEMRNGEVLYLVLVIVTALAFGGTLAWVSRQNDRE
jgi:hypothetical protein